MGMAKKTGDFTVNGNEIEVCTSGGKIAIGTLNSLIKPVSIIALYTLSLTLSHFIANLLFLTEL